MTSRTNTRPQISAASVLPQSAIELCARLKESAEGVDRAGVWPREQLDWCAEADVFRWFVPQHFGGLGWNEDQILAGYLALSQSCLTTTFILTQWHAACRRISGSPNDALRSRLLPQLASGEQFATVGISHLTTSRQHVGRPVLVAQPNADGGFVLDGFSPWITSASAADLLVVGASLKDGRQLMCAVPARREGVNPQPGAELVALTSSCTDQVNFTGVTVAAEEIIAGPIENVMQTNSGGGAGGLQTSTLALGLSMAAVDFLGEQAERRDELRAVHAKLRSDTQDLLAGLADLTMGLDTSYDSGTLRTKANSLVLRSTQAALSAAKGAGFVASHPTGRWAREALFFLVWSCPQPVVSANLCELAQIG